MKCFALAVSVSLMGLGACVAGDATSETQTQQDDQVNELVPKHEMHVRGDARSGGGGGKAAMVYHGGPVMGTANGVTAYFIYYGNWASKVADTSVLESFAANLGGSPYYNINTTYTDGSGARVQNIIRFGGGTYDSYSLGSSHTTLSDSDIPAIVTHALDAASFPADPQAVYFVLTSSDLTEISSSGSGFCTSFCGWHTHTTYGVTDIKYAFVGDPARCPSSCEAQATGPNGTQSADGMVSIIAHELEEANTDPDLDAWYDRRGAENADKCAWTFGTELTAANGAKYNMTIGGRSYLVQQNWVNTTNACAMSF